MTPKPPWRFEYPDGSSSGWIDGRTSVDFVQIEPVKFIYQPVLTKAETNFLLYSPGNWPDGDRVLGPLMEKRQ